MDFPFKRYGEAIKSDNLLGMKVLPSALKVTVSFFLELFAGNDFGSDGFEEKNYKNKLSTYETNLLFKAVLNILICCC